MTPTAQAADDEIRADPSKAFFIDMLTRDIAPIDCILDLLDNAVDKAIELSGLDAMSLLEEGKTNVRLRRFSVKITLNPTSFRIQDTCGGIGIQEAAEDVFLFGNPEERGADLGLSVYGIGMKRAMFKLGEEIEVESSTKEEFFRVDINVRRWKSEPDWKFKFTEHGRRHRKANGQPGTTISIPRLRDGVGERFGQVSFQNDLRTRIATTYALFLKAGLEVAVNGRAVAARLPQIATAPFTPVRRSIHKSGVDILLIAGLSPREDREAHGWYVFCNARMVLEAEKTALTGWGDGSPQFRSKYNHFLGMVFLRSKDGRKLPWRTTKQGVEKEHPVYQAALVEMRIQARPILDFLNDLYPSDGDEEAGAERAAFEKASSMEIDKLPRRETTFTVTRASRETNPWVSVQYARLKSDLERIRAHLGRRRLSASKIGELTFDYFVQQELE